VAISWSETGSGPPVLYLHGLTRSRASDVGAPFDWAPVAARHRLITYDARGHGLSGGEPVPASYEWSQLALDLLALLDEVAPGEVVDGIGVSMGTATLLFAALAQPERFGRLVLAAPPTAWASRAAQQDIYRQSAEYVERHGKAALDEILAKNPPLEIFASRHDFRPPDITESLMPSVMRGAGLSDLPSEAALRTLSTPVLILPWAGDPGHPVSTAATIAASVANAELRVATTLADVEDWGRAAAEFLER
jgi:pimeloyl-ACP methyl ester carboxylesterase